MPQQETFLSQFFIRVDGEDLPQEAMENLLEVVVDNDLNQPDMASVRIEDYDFRWIDAGLFDIGKPLVIGGMFEQTQGEIFNGEITALDTDCNAQGIPTVIVRGYDRSHRLHRGRHSRSFLQMTDSDVVQQIANEVGLTPQVDSTSGVHEYIFQNNETHYEFLRERADRNGFRFYVRGEELHFHPLDSSPDSGPTLEWGQNLRSFRLRVSASDQVNEVEVRGWDYKAKQEIIGRSDSPNGTPQIGRSSDGGQVAQEAFRDNAKMVVVDRPVYTQGEAEAIANSLHDELGGGFIEAEGLCFGEPGLRAGVQVEVRRVGQRYSGTYYVTSATHVYNPTEGYTTTFTVTSKRPANLLRVLDEDPKYVQPYGGNIVVGIVTNNQDPEDLGRVKVKFPWLSNDHESHWARIASPMAGSERGFYCLPEINDEVLVAFEHGDIHRPYILGMLWNGEDTPPTAERSVSDAVQGGEVNRRYFQTRIGHYLVFDDEGGKGHIQIKTCNDHVLIMDDANQKIEITTKHGHRILLDDGGTKQIDVLTKDGRKVNMDDTGSKMTVTDGKGQEMVIDSNASSIAFKCNGDFSIDCKGNLEVKSLGTATLESMGAMNVKGTAGVKVETPASLDQQGSMVNVQGSATVTIQGGLVRIN